MFSACFYIFTPCKQTQTMMSFNKPKPFLFTLFLIVSVTLTYFNSIFNDYALDDAIVITANKFTQKGTAGIEDIFSYDSFTGFYKKEKKLVAGGRYRPLSIATFAMEWEIAPKSPQISHFYNLLLYILTCLLLFAILSKLFPDKLRKTYLALPYIATLIFALHPIHTDAVSNIKGRDEILALLFSLLTFILLIEAVKRSKKEKTLLLIASGITFSMGLFSKENTITYIAVISAGLIFFTSCKFKDILLLNIPLISASLFFLYIRSEVLPDGPMIESKQLMNNPFVDATQGEHIGTVMYTWFEYLKLLVFPKNLTYDYYPYHIPLVQSYNIFAIMGGILYGTALIFALLVFSLQVLYKIIKSKSQLTETYKIFAFSIIAFLAPFSVVSNTFFPIGTFMGERFMYFSSIGFAIALAYGIELLCNTQIKNVKKYATVGISIMLFLYGIKIYDRNKAWENDFTLFTTDVKISYNSAKSTCSAGGKLIEYSLKPHNARKKDQMQKQAHQYLTQSLKIHPKYVDALRLMGNCHFHLGNLDSTVYYYKRLLKYSPSDPPVFENIIAVVNKSEDLDFNIETLEFFHNKKPQDYDITYKLGVLYGKEKRDIEKATPLLERAIAINPKRKDALKDLGVAYAIARRYDDALRILQLALAADPTDKTTLQNIGNTYGNLGDTAKARFYFNEAAKLNVK